jgi:hypothetical protein
MSLYRIMIITALLLFAGSVSSTSRPQGAPIPPCLPDNCTPAL